MKRIPVVASSEVLPPQPTLIDVVSAVTVALSKLPGADGQLILAAQARLEGQHAAGFRGGRKIGFEEGYRTGYAEGLEDGRREALDTQAREEAERATLKASARARRTS